MNFIFDEEGNIADPYQDSTLRLAQWIEENVVEGLVVFAFLASHGCSLWTTNILY